MKACLVGLDGEVIPYDAKPDTEKIYVPGPMVGWGLFPRRTFVRDLAEGDDPMVYREVSRGEL